MAKSLAGWLLRGAAVSPPVSDCRAKGHSALRVCLLASHPAPRRHAAAHPHAALPILSFLQRSRLLEANFLTSYVDRAMERIGKQLKEEQGSPSKEAGGSGREARLPPPGVGRAPAAPKQL